MGIQRYIGTKKAALNKDIGELQKSIAEAAIERLEEAGFNGQNTLLKMIPDYKPFYTAPSESEQKSMHESVRNSTVEWGKNNRRGGFSRTNPK